MVAEQSPAAVEPALRFYEKALSEAERADLPLAVQINGLDEEIGVLRLLLRAALQRRPDDLELMFRGIGLLTRAVAARYRLSRRSEHDLGASLAAATRELAGVCESPKKELEAAVDLYALMVRRLLTA